MNYFLIWISIGFISQWQYILEKISYIDGLKYTIEKAYGYLDILIGVIFFPIYLYVDYVQEFDNEKADKYFDSWVNIIYIFLYYPIYLPLSYLLRLEIKIKG